MKAFIKSVNEKAWKTILTGWDHPMTKNDKGEYVPKHEVEWTANEDKLANNNSKALNAIFDVVDAIKLISRCEAVKKHGKSSEQCTRYGYCEII